jgi:hypothetical protein
MSFWLGVVGSLKAERSFESRPWWCFPKDAQKGDAILMYCPKSISAKYQGIFLQAEIAEPLGTLESDQFRCLPYGRRKKLFFGKLKIIKRFPKPLTAREMKCDLNIRSAVFVARSFQGTIFPVTAGTYNLIIKKLLSSN